MMTVPALVIRRTYAAPPDRVYAAWTTPETAVKFLGPNDVRAEISHMDVRTGGTYRIVMHTPEEDMVVTGTYREVVPGRKLAMTWRWEEDAPADEYDTLLTLEFNPHEGGTELILTHAQFATENSRSNHENGWTAILDHLAKTL